MTIQTARIRVGDAFDVLWARVVKPNECITSCSVKRFFELAPSQNFYKILTLTRRQDLRSSAKTGTKLAITGASEFKAVA